MSRAFASGAASAMGLLVVLYVLARTLHPSAVPGPAPPPPDPVLAAVEQCETATRHFNDHGLRHQALMECVETMARHRLVLRNEVWMLGSGIDAGPDAGRDAGPAQPVEQ